MLASLLMIYIIPMSWVFFNIEIPISKILEIKFKLRSQTCFPFEIQISMTKVLVLNYGLELE